MCCDADAMALKLEAAGGSVLSYKPAGANFPARAAWDAAYSNVRHAVLRVGFFSDHIHLASISVPSKYRGKGYAKSAMAALLAVSDDFKLPVTLEVTYPDDTDTQRGMDPLPWYERLGFESTGMYGDMIRRPKQQMGVKDVRTS